MTRDSPVSMVMRVCLMVVALTASVMNEEIQQRRTAGFDGCLAKPIDVDEFPHSLARILEGDLL